MGETLGPKGEVIVWNPGNGQINSWFEKKNSGFFMYEELDAKSELFAKLVMFEKIIKTIRNK